MMTATKWLDLFERGVRAKAPQTNSEVYWKEQTLKAIARMRSHSQSNVVKKQWHKQKR